MRTTSRVALTALLADASLALPGTAASAADCFPTDPVNCTPAPPDAFRNLASIQPRTYYVTTAGLVLEAEVTVPFATSVTVHREGSSPLGYLSYPTTTPGQVGVLAKVVLGTGTNDLTGHRICTLVDFTYSDGTPGSDGIC